MKIATTKGFTLAEVLITLGIIGIVAAMTIPTVMTRTKGMELHSQLLKSYSILTQALTQLNADNGFNATGKTYPPEERAFYNDFIKYVRVYKKCRLRCNEVIDNGDNNPLMQEYKTFDGSKLVNSQLLDDGQLYLIDGMMLFIQNGTNGFDDILISVDVNGINKGPNQWGMDLFTFQIMNDTGKLIPMGASGTFYTTDSYCSKTSSTNNRNGISCTYKALTDEKFWDNFR